MREGGGTQRGVEKGRGIRGGCTEGLGQRVQVSGVRSVGSGQKGQVCPCFHISMR